MPIYKAKHVKVRDIKVFGGDIEEAYCILEGYKEDGSYDSEIREDKVTIDGVFIEGHAPEYNRFSPSEDNNADFSDEEVEDNKDTLIELLECFLLEITDDFESDEKLSDLSLKLASEYAEGVHRDYRIIKVN